MIAAFGTGDARPRKWSERQFLENHPRIRVGGLLGHTEVTITYGGKTQTVQLEQEEWQGKYARLRPWFRYGSCNRRCRLLVEKDGTFMCQPCSGWEHTCRHRNRALSTVNRVRTGTNAPARRLAREAIIAQVELAALLRATVKDLQRRAKRGGKR
jgi:hypothetical protein